MKLRRSQLKSIIKECLKEILEEDLTLELNVHAGPQLSVGTARRPPQQPFLNPADLGQLTHRDEMIRESLQQRAQSHRSQQSMVPMQQDPMTLPTQQDSSRYNREDAGSRNPSDYLRMGHARSSTRFDPSLDQPIHGQRQLSSNAGQHLQEYAQPEPTAVPAMPGPEVMQVIYADTAQGTLAQQAGHGHSRPGHHEHGGGGDGVMPMINEADPFAVAAANLDPNQIIGSQDWAALAFK